MGTEKIICDTDVLIDYLNAKNQRHKSTTHLIQAEIGVDNIIISAITKMEILAGAQNKNELQKIEKQISRFDTLIINSQITDIAINLIYKHNLSHGLAIPDALIAATTIYTGCPLFTYNSKDYKFIEHLKLYNPALL